MNADRIKEIQQETAYPDSISVQQALLKVWNECEHEKAVKNNASLPHVSGMCEHPLASLMFWSTGEVECKICGYKSLTF